MDSHSFVRAAAAVWPLRSERAFMAGQEGPEEGALKAELEEFVLKRHGVLIEALDLYRRAAWPAAFYTPTLRPRSVLSRFAEVAKEALVSDGARITVRGVGIEPERIARWRASSLLLPADIWVAALCAAEGRLDPPTVWPSILPPQFERWARARDLADSHVHLGSAMGPVSLWTDAMLDPAGLVPLIGGRSEAGLRRAFERTLACALVRIVLAFATTAPRDTPTKHLCRWAAGAVPIQRPLDSDGVLEAIQLACGVLMPAAASTPSLDAKGAALIGVAVRQFVTGAQRSPEGRRGDPVRDVLQLSAAEGCPLELRLMTRCFSAAMSEPTAWAVDTTCLFTQYLRVRAQAFAYVTHEPGIPGFAWFQRFFHRTANFRARSAGMVGDALEHSSSDVLVRSIELRTVPTRSVRGALDTLRDLAENLSADAELGLTLHLATSTSMRGRHRPRDEADVLWFGDWGRAAAAEVQATARLLRAFPEAVLVVRAVDLAGQELALAPWAALGPLLALRAAGEAACRVVHTHHPEVRVDGFRATCHAGEVFLTPTQGVRRIAAYLDAALLRAGDRIGHGIALYEDVASWRGRGFALEPRMERLEDLLFELALARTKAVDTGSAARLAYVEGETLKLAAEIFGACHALSVPLLLEWRALLCNPDAIAEAGWPYAVTPPPLDAKWDTARLLLRATLTVLDVRARGEEATEVSLTEHGELTAMLAIQRHVRARVEDMELSIECCPTSNLLVGDFDRLERHAGIWAGLFDASEGTPLATRLAVALHSDNPLTHATRLEDELSYAYHAFLAAGVSRVEAEARIATLADNGWRGRFTLPATREPATQQIVKTAFRRRGGP